MPNGSSGPASGGTNNFWGGHSIGPARKGAAHNQQIDSLPGGDIETARADERYQDDMAAKYPKPNAGVKAAINAVESVSAKKVKEKP